jgi:hypothetical protein
MADSEQMIMFATRNQNIDLTNMGDVARNVGQMRGFETDRSGRTVRELSQDEMRSALGVPTSFAQEAGQQETIQNYRSDIENARATQGDVAAIQLAFAQWHYQSNNTVAGQMSGVFKDVFGFEIGDLRGVTPTAITALLEERGMEVRVATRAPEVREEPRVAVAAPTEQQREADRGLFEGGLNTYTSEHAGTTDEAKQFALATAVRTYDRITGYAPEQAAELGGMFKKRTGLTIDQAREQI